MSKLARAIFAITSCFSISCNCSLMQPYHPDADASSLSHAKKKDLVPKKVAGRRVRVCLTTYSRNDDRWTRAGLTSTGEPLENMASCAVDPKKIGYHSKIAIPSLGLNMRAVDTGSAVVSRKASRVRGEPSTPVVDIYFDRGSDARMFANSTPYFVDAYILD